MELVDKRRQLRRRRQVDPRVRLGIEYDLVDLRGLTINQFVYPLDEVANIRKLERTLEPVDDEPFERLDAGVCTGLIKHTGSRNLAHDGIVGAGNFSKRRNQ